MRTTCASRLLLLLMFTFPAAAQAQFSYRTTDDTIAITGCSRSLTNAVIPDAIDGLLVTRIEWGTFYSCTNLTNVTIPYGVRAIEEGSFDHPTNLIAIVVDDANSVFSSVGGVLLTKDQTVIIRCPAGKAGGYTVPNSVTDIYARAFGSCARLTSVTMGDSTTGIGGSAFESCTSLSNVTFAGRVTSIGRLAFGFCTNLTAVAIPDSVTDLGMEAFASCTRLANVAIGSGITLIAPGAFAGCTSLAGIIIPESVTDIGSGAFSGCTGLTSITIPDSVLGISSGAFSSCTRLANVTIGSRVTGIGDSAFSSCTGLTNLVLSTGLATVGNSAFCDCTSLTSVTLPSSVTNIDIAAFCRCSALTKVTIPDSVIRIDYLAFASCTSLTSVTIPDSVTLLGSEVFLGCTNLTAITVDAANPEYSSVGGVLFNKSQTTLVTYPAGRTGSGYVVPSSVTTIGEGAFASCNRLTNVTVPDSVTRLADRAFFSCIGLTGIHFLGNPPVLGSSVFDDVRDATAYYSTETAGWDPTFGGLPTAPWNPRVQTTDASFGVRTNRFGFNINWGSDRVVVVEACADLANPNWVPVGTNALTGGSSYFGDSQWADHPARFYRLRSP
jgi:hypothetical protein